MQWRSPSRGAAAAVAAIPVHLWLSVCVYVYVRKAERGWAGGWMSGWIGLREEEGGWGGGGGVRAGEKSRVAELLCRQRPLNLSSTGC